MTKVEIYKLQKIKWLKVDEDNILIRLNLRKSFLLMGEEMKVEMTKCIR